MPKHHPRVVLERLVDDSKERELRTHAAKPSFAHADDTISRSTRIPSSPEGHADFLGHADDVSVIVADSAPCSNGWKYAS